MLPLLNLKELEWWALLRVKWGTLHTGQKHVGKQHKGQKRRGQKHKGKTHPGQTHRGNGTPSTSERVLTNTEGPA